MNFIVTTSTRGASRKQIWHSDEPLKIGFPIQWVMEKTATGVRITYLGGKLGQVTRESVREVSFSDLKRDPKIVLEKLHLSIVPAVHTKPAFSQNQHVDTDGRQLAIYRTLGDWVLDAEPLLQNNTAGEYTARIGSNPVFKLTRSGDSFQIVPATSQVFLIQDEKKSKTELQSGSPLQLSSRELASATLRFGNAGWKFGWVLQGPVATAKHKLPVLDLGVDLEAPFFKKALRGTGIALAALILISLVWPQPKQEELIPPQVAKIILTPKHHMASGAAASHATSTAQKKVQETAVVQAFRAKALRSAISGLMKGGMTKLLAQSDFIAGHRNEAIAAQLLSSHSKDFRATAPEIGDIGAKNVKVASIGGNGQGNGPNAVGYGKGQHASVAGQGKGFVSMDLANSSVDEGLTKDQVGEVIHRHLSEVRYCYESAMIRMPDIEGKLIVDFTIGGNGMVKTAESKSSTLPDPRLDDCIIRRLLTWKFPLPVGGVDVSVTYPFIFKTLGR